MNTSIIISNTTVNNGTMTGKAPHMTSLEIAELTGKNHFDVLRAIRNMEPAWKKVTECKFAVSEYKDSTRRTLPCYSLTKTLRAVVLGEFLTVLTGGIKRKSEYFW